MSAWGLLLLLSVTVTNAYICREATVDTCSSSDSSKCPSACVDGDKKTPDLDCLKACLPWQKCFGNPGKEGCPKNALACQPLVQISIGDTAKIDVAKAACVPGKYGSDECMKACLPGLQCVFAVLIGKASDDKNCPAWEKACSPVVPLLEPCVACPAKPPADFSCLSACVPHVHCIGKGCKNAKAAACNVLKSYPLSKSERVIEKAKTKCEADPGGASCIQACFEGITCVIDSFAGVAETADCKEWVSACKKAFPAASSCPAADALTYCTDADSSKCPTTCKDGSGKAKPDLACLKSCLPWQKCFGNPSTEACRNNALACQPLVGIEVGDEAKLKTAKAACVEGKYGSDACLQACLPGIRCVFSALAGLGTADKMCAEWERVCSPAVPSIDPCVACDAHAIPDFACLHACQPYIHCVGKGCASSKATPCKALASAVTSKVERRIEQAKLKCKANPMSGSCIKECMLGIKCVIEHFAGETSRHECIGWVAACKDTFAPATTTTTTTTTTPTTPTTPTTVKPKKAKATTTSCDEEDDLMSGTLSNSINMITIIMVGVYTFYIGL